MIQALFTAGELAEATGGCWKNPPSSATCWSINTDSRTLQIGECFVPLAGERFDGHDFLEKLPENSVVLAQTGRTVPDKLHVLYVKDTLKAYQDIARFHRCRMQKLKIAAVTGSVGKTSVKEMLRAIFTEAAGESAVLYTLGNTNNQIGVPQNLLRLTGNIRYAVIEMGTNHHGEIAPLSCTALPDVAVINTIAACHLEHLGDLDGVAQEKSAIFAGLAASGAAVYPGECAGHEIIARNAGKFRSITFGSSKQSDATAEYLAGSLNGSRVKLHFHSLNKTCEFDWELSGEHQAANAAAAAAAALALNIAPEVIARGLSRTTLPGKRMNSQEVNGCTWINDAYNANPCSMKSSLDCIAANTPADKPLLLILGDMLELGKDEIAYHREIVEFVRQKFAGGQYKVIYLGSRFAQALQDDCTDLELPIGALSELPEAIEHCRQTGMTVFLKSSNGIGLCRVEPC